MYFLEQYPNITIFALVAVILVEVILLFYYNFNPLTLNTEKLSSSEQVFNSYKEIIIGFTRCILIEINKKHRFHLPDQNYWFIVASCITFFFEIFITGGSIYYDSLNFLLLIGIVFKKVRREKLTKRRKKAIIDKSNIKIVDTIFILIFLVPLFFVWFYLYKSYIDAIAIKIALVEFESIVHQIKTTLDRLGTKKD